MRAVSACLLFLVAASVVSAQSCATTAPSSDPLNTGSASGCALVQTCQKNLCACTGSTSAFPGCLSANTASCSSTSKCYSAYYQCLMATTAARQNATDAACSAFGNSVYISMMAALTGSSFNSSALAQSCNYNACQLQNQTGSTTGCGATIVGAACSSANLLNGVTTNSPVVATPTPTRATDIIASLRISGSSWGNIINNTALYAQASTAIQSDLATLFGVQSSYVGIFSMNVGSLIVVFGVYQGSGKSPASLSATVSSAAASSSWLKSIATVYSTVSSEVLTVQGFTALSTAGPTTLAPGSTPAGSSAVAATGAWAVAVLAVVLGVFA